MKTPAWHYKVYSGVLVKTRGLWPHLTVNSRYKCGSIDPLRKLVKPGDKMVTVGGGYGVTAVVGALQGASVKVYEGSKDWANFIRKTVALNGVAGKVEVIEGIVGEVYDIYGVNSDVTIFPDQLPNCDILELDCEGAERSIISKMQINPRVVVAEIHPRYGISLEEMEDIFHAKAYRITEKFQFTRNSNCTVVAVQADDLVKG